jgi:hypothetical protein
MPFICWFFRRTFNFPHSSLCEILDLVTLTPYETCLISPTSLFHTRYDEYTSFAQIWIFFRKPTKYCWAVLHEKIKRYTTDHVCPLIQKAHWAKNPMYNNAWNFSQSLVTILNLGSKWKTQSLKVQPKKYSSLCKTPRVYLPVSGIRWINITFTDERW